MLLSAVVRKATKLNGKAHDSGPHRNGLLAAATAQGES